MGKDGVITVRDVMKKISEIEAYKSYVYKLSDFFSGSLTQADPEKVSEIHSYIHRYIDIPYDIKAVFTALIRLLGEEQSRLEKLVDNTPVEM